MKTRDQVAPFGLSLSDYEFAVAFKKAMLADGWISKPTYEHEPEERAASLDKDGFHAMVITRLNKNEKTGKEFTEGCVSIWAKDGLAIDIPETYNWNFINNGVTRCGFCQKENVETERVGFAGRCCKSCLPTVRPKVEFPGWSS